MPNFSTIALIACFAYAIESIFGFGGTIIFLGISGFFFDFNSLLKLAMIVGLSSGLAVLIQSYKYVSLNHLIKIFDPRQDGWVNHREFVYPVYTKLNREGCSDDKDDKAEDFDQFVSDFRNQFLVDSRHLTENFPL